MHYFVDLLEEFLDTLILFKYKPGPKLTKRAAKTVFFAGFEKFYKPFVSLLVWNQEWYFDNLSFVNV